jgi:hypothetical protein
VILRIITLSIIDITLILRKMTRGIAIKCHYAESHYAERLGTQNVDMLAPRMYHEKKSGNKLQHSGQSTFMKVQAFFLVSRL